MRKAEFCKLYAGSISFLAGAAILLLAKVGVINLGRPSSGRQRD